MEVKITIISGGVGGFLCLCVFKYNAKNLEMNEAGCEKEGANLYMRACVSISIYVRGCMCVCVLLWSYRVFLKLLPYLGL